MAEIDRTLEILILVPPGAGARSGNQVTAERWAARLDELGHRVHVSDRFDGEPRDLFVCLHARRGAPALRAIRSCCPERPVVLALTGTDLYVDLPAEDDDAQQALAAADRVVALHEDAADQLPPEARDKVRVILQSACAADGSACCDPARFDVCVIGHLRPIKDPFRTAEATRGLPAESRVRVLHIGAALEPAMEEQAQREQEENPRYHWLGELPRAETLCRLAGCDLLVLSSQAEGGANVLSEAAVCGVPILASRIASSLGLLGEDHPGWFEVGNTQALTTLIQRAENDAAFRDALRASGERLAARVRPEQERAAWQALLAELIPA